MIYESADSINYNSVFYSVRQEVFGIPFFLKLEHLNMAGSIKNKTARFLIQSLEEQNKIQPGKTKIIESSSGNLGVALSIICKEKNIPFTCITDPNTSSYHTKLMRLYGAEILCVQERDENGGYLGSRIELLNKLLTEDADLVWTNQYANTSNIRAHYETTAQEICHEFAKLDYLFVGAGTSGTLMGCLQYIHKYRPETKVVAVDIEGSMTFNNKKKQRHIPGLGTSKAPAIANKSLLDELVIVSEKDTINCCNKLLENTGLLLGGSTGSVIAGIQQYMPNLTNNNIIAAISPDSGERYLDTVYNPEWIKNKIGDV